MVLNQLYRKTAAHFPLVHGQPGKYARSGNTFAVGVTTVPERVAKVSTTVKKNLIDASILLIRCMFELQSIFKSMKTLLKDG